MKRIFVWSCCLGVTVWIAVMHQPLVIASNVGAARRQSSAKPAETSLTLVGCLKYWDGDTDATVGASSTPSRRPAGPASRYMLANVESRNQSGGVPAASYALAGASTVNLAGHVNHKVQVSGTIAPDGYGHSAETPASPASLQTLRVTSLKMISTPCP